VENEYSKEEQNLHFHDEWEIEYVLVCYGERQVLLFNLQRLSILAKKG
jgi:hypothetical protein